MLDLPRLSAYFVLMEYILTEVVTRDGGFFFFEITSLVLGDLALKHKFRSFLLVD